MEREQAETCRPYDLANFLTSTTVHAIEALGTRPNLVVLWLARHAELLRLADLFVLFLDLKIKIPCFQQGRKRSIHNYAPVNKAYWLFFPNTSTNESSLVIDDAFRHVAEDVCHHGERTSPG